MFTRITMIDYFRPLAERAKARKSVGPYTWSPSKPGNGRGFYQSSNGLRMDPRGSTIDLRLDYANTHLPYSRRYGGVQGFYCDEFGDTMLVPIIARLPHGRGFLAGWTMGKGMCAALDSYIWSDIADAARAAFDMAEADAEREQEYQAEHSDDDD